MSSLGRRHALFGAGAWLAWLIAMRPAPRSEGWAEALVLLAALVLVPLGFVIALERRALAFSRAALSLQPVAALLLLPALTFERGILAAALCVPWLGVLLLAALAGGRSLLGHRGGSSPALLFDTALLFVPVGALWLLMARLGFRPLGFSDPIVLLTAIHFHYAGFAVPIALGCALRATPRRAIDGIALWAVIGGVPLVAAGITATQLGYAAWLEPVAAWAMALGGLLTAAIQLDAARRLPGPRLWLTLSALALGFGMLLAALYGARTLWTLAVLDIPWMRALHGSANALGFALPALIAWSSAPDRGPELESADEDRDRERGGAER